MGLGLNIFCRFSAILYKGDNVCFLLGSLLTIPLLKTDLLQKAIKALTALVGRLSLSVGWENDPERGFRTVSFNP